MPQLFALLVGIDTYQHQRPLRGCVSDVARMSQYLRQAVAPRFGVEMHTLTNADATRAGLVEAFTTHLGQAGPGDVALFYFSGHGGQEEAAPVFAQGSEADGLLEGIVCHDSGGGVPLLADKELRWLIRELAAREAHILTIFDACHSGDNTRSTAQPQPDLSQHRPRLAEIAPQRAWDDFLFARVVSEAAAKTQPLETLIPQGRHVHLSACLDVELAYENDAQGGIFSHYLLEALQATQGRLAYLDLIRQVRLRMLHGAGGVSQHPQLYVLRDYAEDAAREFLGGAARHRPLRAQVVYNVPQQEWQIDKGQLHGLRTMPDLAQAAPVIITLPGDRSLTVKIAEARLDHSRLHLDPAQLRHTPLVPGQVYDAWLSGLLQASLVLDLRGEAAGVAEVQTYAAKQAASLAIGQVQIEAGAAEADYGIMVARAGEQPYLALTLPGDERPLARQVMGWDEAAVAELLGQVAQLSRWHFARHLQAPEGGNLPAQPIAVAVHQHETVHAPDADGGFALAYDDPQAANPTTELGFAFTNTTGQRLYVAVLYLDTDFSMRPNLLENQVVTLPAGATVWGLGGRRIPVKWDPLVKAYNWPSDRFFLRVIAASHPFEVGDFLQKGLPLPLTPAQLHAQTGHRGTARSLSWDDEVDVPGFAAPSWRTQAYEVALANPFYQP